MIPGKEWLEKAKVLWVLRQITIEPMMILNAIGVSVTRVTEQQLILYKTCLHSKYDVSDDFCENINDNTTSPAYENDIEPSVAKYNVIKSIVDHTFPILLSFYLGAWTDIHGRKLLIFITMTGKVVAATFGVLNAYFISWRKEIFLVTAVLPEVLTGGYLAFVMSVYSFISDNSSPEFRTVRLAFVAITWHLGNPIANALGGFLFSQGGYVCVFATKLTLLAITMLLFVVRLWNFEENVTRRRKEMVAKGEISGKVSMKELLHPRHIKDSIKTTFRSRPDNKRPILLMCIANMLLQMLPHDGESTFQYLFTVRFFGWGVEEYSIFQTVYFLVSTFGLICCIPLSQWFGLPDAFILLLVTLSELGGRITFGFSYSATWIFYAAMGVDFMGHGFAMTIRSIISKCVHPTELGKIYAMLTSTESLVPILASNVYSIVYLATVETSVPGAAYFMSAGLTCVPLLLTIGMIILLKGQHVTQEDSFPGERAKKRMSVISSHSPKIETIAEMATHEETARERENIFQDQKDALRELEDAVTGHEVAAKELQEADQEHAKTR